MEKAHNFNNLAGKRFHMLVAIEPVGKNKCGQIIWLCNCDCGMKANVVGSKLISGHTKSCGCLKRRRNNLSKTRLFRIWKGMIDRCENPYKDNYYWYGLKGIKICYEWHNFFAFYQWAILNGYADSLSLDRIDCNGDYCPENCRWITQKEQCNNRSKNRIVYFNGNRYTVSQFAELINCNYWTIIRLLNKGIPPEEIVASTEVKNER